MNKKLSMILLGLVFTYNANSQIRVPNSIILQNGAEINEISFNMDDIYETNSKTIFDHSVEKFVTSIIKYEKEKFYANDFIKYIIKEIFQERIILSESGMMKLIAITKHLGINYYIDIDEDGNKITIGEITNNKIKFIIKLRKLTKQIIKTNRRISQYRNSSQANDAAVAREIENLERKISPLQEKRIEMVMNLQLLEEEINSIQTSISEQQDIDSQRRNELILKAEKLEEIFTEAQRSHDQELLSAESATEEQPGLFKRIFGRK